MSPRSADGRSQTDPETEAASTVSFPSSASDGVQFRFDEEAAPAAPPASKAIALEPQDSALCVTGDGQPVVPGFVVCSLHKKTETMCTMKSKRRLAVWRRVG